MTQIRPTWPDQEVKAHLFNIQEMCSIEYIRLMCQNNLLFFFFFSKKSKLTKFSCGLAQPGQSGAYMYDHKECLSIMFLLTKSFKGCKIPRNYAKVHSTNESKCTHNLCV
jgi:hypothetical protein